jgi:hypothetical protein
MAYLRIRSRGKRRYYYIVESRRRAGTVRQKILQYLGESPDEKKVSEALRYWKVGRGSGATRRRKA